MKNFIGFLFLILSLNFGMSTVSATEIGAGLVTKSEDGITYVNGGLDVEQQREIKALRNDFNLQLTFVEKSSGAYLADVDVLIQDTWGKEIIALPDMGPVLLIQLAPGNYRVKAESGDKVQTKTVNVNQQGIKDLYFYW